MTLPKRRRVIACERAKKIPDLPAGGEIRGAKSTTERSERARLSAASRRRRLARPRHQILQRQLVRTRSQNFIPKKITMHKPNVESPPFPELTSPLISPRRPRLPRCAILHPCHPAIRGFIAANESPLHR